MRLTKVFLATALSAFALTQPHAASHAPGLAPAQTARKETRGRAVADRPRTRRAHGVRDGGASAFVERVRAGDVRAARRMLARGADPDSKSAKGAPAVVIAAKRGSVALVRALLDAGADVNADDNNQYTALHFAAQSGDLALLELLLARGADVNKNGYDDHTVLMFAMHGASWIRMPEALRRFVLRDEEDGDEDENLIPKRLGTPESYRRVAARLIKAGAEVNAVADCGETALHFATCDAGLTKTLLAARARVDYGLSSPLCILADGEWEKIRAGYLGELGGGLRASRRRALARALRRWRAETAHGRGEVVRLLTEAGATRRGCGDDEEEEDEPEH